MARRSSLVVSLTWCLVALVVAGLLWLPGVPRHAVIADEPSSNLNLESSDWESEERRPAIAPNVESQLSQLVQASESNGLRAASEERGVYVQDDLIRVVVEGDEDQVPRIEAALETCGATIEATWRGFIQCLVPPEVVEVIAQIEGVLLVRLPVVFGTCVESQGVPLINADEWQTSGVEGSGTKIGVLDSGFWGYDELLGTELPPSVATRWPMTGGGGSSVHGRTCAELVHDVAPGASLYLSRFDSEVDWYRAAQWLIDQEMDAISCSIFWTGSARDGTSPQCAPIEAARDADIPWVQAAGNFAFRHWIGPWISTDEDQYHEWTTDPLDEGNAIGLNAGTNIYVSLTWDDEWGAATNDYDLYIYHDSEWFAWSLNDQAGGFPNPHEAVQFTAPEDGTYAVVVEEYATDRDCEIEVLVTTSSLEHWMPEGSVCDTAASPYALTVGAVSWETSEEIQLYSSQGPTADGRVKPDIVGPDHIQTTWFPGGYNGTSAAAAHVAGAAALVRQAYPALNADDVQDYLEQNAADIEPAGKDSVFGSGRVLLPSLLSATMDYGDAPDAYYRTLVVGDGARHTIDPGFCLGATVDAEYDGQPDSGATGDDMLDGADDEDGVVFTSSLVAGTAASVDVTASASGYLDAWMDFNDDGDWDDENEQIFATQTLSAGYNHLAFSIPADMSASEFTYSRFRFSSNGGLGYTGEAPDGEVEDYRSAIGSAPDIRVSPTSFAVTVVEGETRDCALTIFNDGSVELNCAISDRETPVEGTPTGCSACDASSEQSMLGNEKAETEGSQRLQVASLSPEFLGFLENPPEESFGYVPPPVDLSHLARIPVREALGAGPLPASFDWRDLGKVTPVKNQNPCGTCWIFGTISVLESAVLIEEDAEYNFSEQSVALCLDRSWVSRYDDSDDPCNAGGWSWLAAEALIRKGAVLEACNPYYPLALCCDGSCDCDSCPTLKKVNGYRLVTNNQADTDLVKEAVSAHGPVTMAFYYSGSHVYSDDTYGAVYDCASCSSANHLVSIIGWDDSIPHIETEGTGAWLVKNSWGPAWGNSGYFWLAYDSSCMREIAYLAYTDYDPAEELLYWDEAGWVDSAGAGNNSCWMANTYTASGGGSLTHADFWTTGNNAEYEIYVYMDGDPSNDLQNLCTSQAGTCNECGYYSVPLASPIHLDDGQEFTVAVKMTTPGYDYPIPIEIDIPSFVEPPIQYYVSYVKVGDTDAWFDVAPYGHNVCLRARVQHECSWLSESPDSVNVGAGGSQQVTLTIDTSGLETGDYTADVVVSSNDPDEGTSLVPVTLHVVPTWVDFELPLNEGWNMVSVPVVPDDDSPETLFPDAEAIYTWDPDADAYAEVSATGDFTTIEPERAYWVASSITTVMFIEGAPVTAMENHPIWAGWNMVGSIFGGSVDVNDLADNPSGHIQTDAIYTWDPVAKRFVCAEEIVPGKGYWIPADQPCMLTMSPPS